jgi:hypothetical protein
VITTPDDYAWLSGGCFTYVRGLIPEQVVTRLGARVEDFTPMTFGEMCAAPSGPHGSGVFLGITTVGDWAFIVETSSRLGITEEIIMPLSAGTRLVSHRFLDIKALDYFFWIEDGKLRFCFIAQEGYMEEVPDELAETMNLIDSVYPPLTDPHEGPMFLLAERLTGITLTPQLIKESTYLCGVVSEPLSTDIPWPW